MCPDAEHVPSRAIEELLAVYAALDAELASLGVTCRQCGRCCNFAVNDYRLYASFLERALVLRDRGRPRLRPNGECAFLAGQRCDAHAVRPLGCRTFFCDPAYKDREQALCHRYLRRIRAIADAHGLPWAYEPFFGE